MRSKYQGPQGGLSHTRTNSLEIDKIGVSGSGNDVLGLKITVHQHPRQLSQPRRDVFKSGQRGELVQSAFVEPKNPAETIFKKIILLPSIKRGVKLRRHLAVELNPFALGHIVELGDFIQG